MKTLLIYLAAFVAVNSVYGQTLDDLSRLELKIIKSKNDSALVIADEILRTDTTTWQVYYYQGKAYYSKFKFFDALRSFQKANRLDSANISIENALAETYDAIGKREDAIQTYYDQYLRDTARVQTIVNLANLFRKNKEYGSAVHYYRKASMIDTSNFYYYKQQAYCIDKMNLPGPAMMAYEYSIHLNPYDLFVYQQLANLYNSERQFDKAIFTSERGLKVYPLDNQLMKIRAYASYLNKDFDTAIVHFNELMEYGDSSVFTFKYRGLCYYEKQFYVDAINDLKWAYEQMSTDPEVCFFLGSSYARSNRLKDGLFYLGRATSLLAPPRNETAKISSEKANIYIKQERYQAAIAELRNAYKNESKPYYSYRMAQVYDYYLKDKKMALDCYEGYLTLAVEPDTTRESNLLIESFKANPQVVENAAERIRILKEELFFEEAQKEKD